MLEETYKNVRDSVVAIVRRVEIIPKDQPPPAFPTIIGTGFVVDANGLIVTNAHIIDALNNLPRGEEDSNTWPATCIMLRFADCGLLEVRLDILSVIKICAEHPDPYYGPPDGPDIGFIHVNVNGLPSLDVAADLNILEGMPVATAGFPMGTDALEAPGWLHQICPTLQSAIVSAVQPFTCRAPHSFSINAMTQGGASGSPVFMPDSGKVVGVLYGGLVDYFQDNEGKPYKIPTNISYVVPAHYLWNALVGIQKKGVMKPPGEALTLEDILKTYRKRNLFEDPGGRWRRIGEKPS